MKVKSAYCCLPLEQWKAPFNILFKSSFYELLISTNILGTRHIERMAVLKESIRWTCGKTLLNHPIIFQQPKETILFSLWHFSKN